MIIAFDKGHDKRELVNSEQAEEDTNAWNNASELGLEQVIYLVLKGGRKTKQRRYKVDRI